MTNQQLVKFAGDLADATREHVKSAIAPLIQRIEALEQQIKTLEPRKHRGAWTPAATYRSGDRVTYGGQQWILSGVDNLRGVKPGDGLLWVLTT